MSCARRPLPWPGSLEPASPGLTACRSSPPFGPWNFAAFGSTPWDERRARPLEHGGAREDAPRGTLASADAARLPPDTRQGVQQPRLHTLVARYIKTLALIRWRESPVVHTPRHPRASHPGPRVRPPETPRQPSRPVLASAPSHPARLASPPGASTRPGRTSKGTRTHTPPHPIPVLSRGFPSARRWWADFGRCPVRGGLNHHQGAITLAPPMGRGLAPSPRISPSGPLVVVQEGPAPERCLKSERHRPHPRPPAPQVRA